MVPGGLHARGGSGASRRPGDPTRSVPSRTAPAIRPGPAIGPAERLLIFGRGSGSDDRDLYFATRSRRDLAFDEPRSLPLINTAYYEGESFITADGCTLYFVSTRPGGSGS